MMQPHLHALIRANIRHGHSAAIDGNADLRRDLHADDIDMTCIAMALDEAFGIELTDSDISTAETVADLERLVAGKSAKAA